ncbi:SDR family oxidoreductase [Terrilactibacillus sp. BCM23-1]|uniref:SDR family oxidoreductase n=1 Tax=Terrilactibacillus tamarindi TaxID=2599694 RepID=A0A6N8CSM2_9BACI|nr:SDR family NAD(P)-dependent oxidoreductase [Terrilactibacillus tamarindi]MTT32197.1 SDR family oxidoreductase [Terrilactibacillus tamarindi]
MKRFENKTVLITGAGSGIGKETALSFAKEGAYILLNDLESNPRIHQVAKLLAERGVSYELKLGDISNADKVKMMFSNIERLDILVNNAGYLSETKIIDMTNMEWDRMIKVHLYGTFYCTREATKLMLKEKTGRIINVSSDLGQIGCENLVHYSAAKGGIISFTKALARELASNGINVNSVAPGGTLTPMVEKMGDNYIHNEGKKYPLLRLGTPSEIANVILFLASNDSSFMTGQIIGVNGGGVMNG